MTRVAGLGIALLTVFVLAGCGGNPREEKINEALGFFANAADNARQLRNDVAKAVGEAKKTNKKLAVKDFKPAEDTAKKLREYGKKLVEVKGEIDILKENTSDAEKRRLDARFQGELTDLFKRLETEQRALDKELVEAQKLAEPAAMDHLRKTIADSREEFLILTKPR
jgi:hypothetical protein